MVVKLLELSTAHITPETARALDVTQSFAPQNLYIDKLLYGWLITWGEELGPWSDNLNDIIEFAIKSDCNYVRLDPDASLVDLPIYDW